MYTTKHREYQRNDEREGCLECFLRASFINLQDMKLQSEDESTNKHGTKIKTRCVNREKAFTTPTKKYLSEQHVS